MPTYLRPGVYIEEISSGSKPIEGVGTSTAAFVGYTTRGDIGKPTLIFKWDDYERLYGGIRNTGGSLTGDPMGHSVSAFFQNGGTAAYIVRLASGDPGPAKAEGYLRNPNNNAQLIRFQAVNEGEWANNLRVRLADRPGGGFNVEVGRLVGSDFKANESFTGINVEPGDPNYIEGRINGRSELITADAVEVDVTSLLLGTSTSGNLSGLTDFTVLNGKSMTVKVDGSNRAVAFTGLTNTTTLADVATAIQTQVRNGASAQAAKNFTAVPAGNTLVLTSGSHKATSSVAVVGTGDDATDAAKVLKLGGANGIERTGQESFDTLLPAPGSDVVLAGGTNGSEPVAADYTQALAAFEKIRAVSMIALPGQTWSGQSKTIVQAAVAHAEKMRNRMILVDPPSGTPLVTEQDVNGLGLPTSTYTALYYPWVKVSNPYYNAEKNPGAPVTVLAPPSGFAAGMWSRIDGRRGVWKAPAGVETALLGVAGLEYQVEDGEQEQLNPLGVNCYRTLPSFGPVIWGTRTLSTNADPEWRYVPVRRTAIFIEQSVYNGIQWAVFEPNDHRLWSSLRVNIDSFLNGLFRSGAFQGQKASDAYFVRCGLGDTMTQGDIDRGQVIVVVGFAPLKPAEFVIVRIQQKVGQ